MVYSLQETADGGLKVSLISKTVRLVTEKPSPTTTDDAGPLNASSGFPPPGQPGGEASKPVAPVATTSSQIMYSDEESTPFFRRLAFSTDGALLVTPAGQYEDPSSSSSSINKKVKKQTSTSGADADNSVIIASSSPAVLEKKPSSKVNGGATSSNGKVKNKNNGPSPTSYVFARGQLANESPIAHLPGHRTSSIVVKFNPVLWDLRSKKRNQMHGNGKGKEKAVEQEGAHGDNGSSAMEVDDSVHMDAIPSTVVDGSDKPETATGILDLKARTIYALATHDTILLYDTQQEAPICMFSSLHFAAFTDLAWYVSFFFFTSIG